MHLAHLGLPVRDEQRSGRFYEAYFGFDPAATQRYDDGTVIIRSADGFDLALHSGHEAGPLPAFLHFGFRLTHPDEVRQLLGRLRADGVDADPDGYRVETYWEPAGRSQRSA